MITQDNHKYLAPKYRLIARITNQKVITQIAYSTLAGDRILCQATSDELKKYGMTTGLTSYSAAYATGLLLARKVLAQLKLNDLYKGNDKIDGNDYNVSTTPNPKRRPFMAVLDIGIRRPTIGNRVFGVMKGATDGGIHVPHSVKKFPGFQKGETKKDAKYDAAIHRDRIFGVHVDAYIELLKEKSDEVYKKQFSKWDECLKKNGVESVEDLMEKVIQAIRKETFAKTEKKASYKPKFLNSEKTEIQGKTSVYKRNVR
jgi:large subunit ribosomal protein L5e